MQCITMSDAALEARPDQLQKVDDRAFHKHGVLSGYDVKEMRMLLV